MCTLATCFPGAGVAQLVEQLIRNQQVTRSSRVAGSIITEGFEESHLEVLETMGDANKCAHPACQCIVPKGGPYGSYCSEHCKESGQRIELRCGCQHAACR